MDLEKFIVIQDFHPVARLLEHLACFENQCAFLGL